MCSLLCAEVLEFGNPLYNDDDTHLVDPTEPDTMASGTMEAAAMEDTIKEATTEIWHYTESCSHCTG